jgi:CBS domain-containing protein
VNRHELEDELQEMFTEDHKVPKILSNETIQQPIRTLELLAAACVDVSATVDTAIAVMQQRKTGCVLVTQDELLVGILTERDVLMKLANRIYDLSRVPVPTVMTRSPEVLRLDDTIAYAMNLMSVGGYRHVPIVDETRKPLSVLSVRNVISYIVEHFPDEILNLPPRPLRSTSEREGA